MEKRRVPFEGRGDQYELQNWGKGKLIRLGEADWYLKGGEEGSE